MSWRIWYVLVWIVLIIGWSINGLTLANAETFSNTFLSRVLISVVRGCEQTWLHQNPEKVSRVDK